MPIRITCPVVLVEHRWGPATTFRLVVNKTELPGRSLCVSRRFVQSGEMAEGCDNDSPSSASVSSRAPN
jgi:hypothetical protein